MNRRDGLKLIAAAPLALAAATSMGSTLARSSPVEATDSEKAKSGTADTAPTEAWSRAAAMPLSTQEIYPILHNGEIVVAGGIASKAGVPYFTDRCVAYNSVNDTWREHSTLPEPRHHAALVTAHSRLFLMGGFNGGFTRVWRMRDTVLEYADGEWNEIKKLPQKQAEGVIATSPEGRIHVVTGQSPKGERNHKRSDHREIHTHWSWHPDASNWQTHAPIPTARNSATGGWVGNELIVAGGRTADGNLDSVEIYSLDEDSWRTAQPMPLPQAGTASVVANDGLIVFGGEIFIPESGVFKEVWRYTPDTDSWLALPPLRLPRHGLGAVKVGRRVYVVGGATRPGGSGTSNAVEVLDLDAV